MKLSRIILILVVVFLGGFLVYRNSNQFDIPSGETKIFESDKKAPILDVKNIDINNEEINFEDTPEDVIIETTDEIILVNKSNRQILVTDGVKHSIPLNEILSGGPAKDGIPSIDNPKFISIKEASDFLVDSDVGLGLVINGEARFYPYKILVWHEIVNDKIGEKSVLVTYCPLCATGVVFDPIVNGIAQEFGVSGKLWQSNLLMYNRSADPDDESLWSQVLGEAVLGKSTGVKLDVLTSDTVLYGNWIEKWPDTKVLSKDTGAIRTYGRDPYGDYYTNESVSFGASFSDIRAHPKAFVLGIEINGKYKAYDKEALNEGITEDNFAGSKITIEKSSIGEVRIFVGESKQEISYIGGFWFSWLAVHPETEIFR